MALFEVWGIQCRALANHALAAPSDDVADAAAVDAVAHPFALAADNYDCSDVPSPLVLTAAVAAATDAVAVGIVAHHYDCTLVLRHRHHGRRHGRRHHPLPPSLPHSLHRHRCRCD